MRVVARWVRMPRRTPVMIPQRGVVPVFAASASFVRRLAATKRVGHGGTLDPHTGQPVHDDMRK